MGSSRKNIISKESVLKAALEIINNEGLDALNVRRIAEEVGVKAASLYHHFKNKDEIVVGAAELALKQTPLRLPMNMNSEWQDLLFAGILQERDFLLTHPELLSVIIRRRSEGFASQYLEQMTQHLLDMGVPIEVLGPIYDALECYTIGHVVRLISENEASKPKADKQRSPLLTKLGEKQFIDEDEIYNIAVLSIISTMKLQYTLHKNNFES